MREIKFRIWCKQTEEMHTVEHMAFDNGELWYVEDEDRHAQPPYFMDRNDSVLMQYTGLKDKNGREIYEGDILAIKSTRYIVGYREYSGGWQLEVRKGEYCAVMIQGNCDALEIIGNIYENPELLEDK